MSTLGNFIVLEKDREKVLKIREGSFRIERRTITDNLTKQPKSINTAAMDVTQEDGKPVTKTFSTTSDKLANTLLAFHLSSTLYTRNLGITMRGEGFAREYSVRQF